MRYLPVCTVALWLAIILGYVFVRDILLLEYVKFPLILLLSVLLPVCFWELQKNDQRIRALLFIFIFLFNVGAPAYGAWHNHKMRVAFDDYISIGIDPQMANLLVTGDSIEERKLAAQILYEKFGVQLPYKTGEQEFVLFIPDKSNRDNYVLNHDTSYRARTAVENLDYQNNFIFGIILLQAVLFAGLLVFLILYDRSKVCSPSSTR